MREKSTTGRATESDEAESTDASSDSTAAGGIDTEILSDLFVNAVPIAIIAAFVLGFGLLSPDRAGGDPLVFFHGALIAGVVLVSYVAARVVGRQEAPLEGSAAGDPERPDDE